MPQNELSLNGFRAPRMDEYFGLWAIDDARGSAMFDRISRMDLHIHAAEHGTPRLASKTQTVPASGSPTNTASSIALIPVTGVLMKQVSSMDDDSISTVQLRRDIRNAINDPAIGGIIYLFDTPGGTVAGTSDLAADIAASAAAKPVIGYIEDLCASAGFWCACQCPEIYANNATALVGSIGTYMGIYDMSKHAEKLGIRALVFKTGALKGAGFPGAEITDAQQAHFQSIVDQTQEFFSAAVAAGRNLPRASVNDLATGGVFLADDAVAKRLIDGVESFDAVVARMSQMIEKRSGGGTVAQHKGKPMTTANKGPKADDTTTSPASPAPEPVKDEEKKEEAAAPAAKPEEAKPDEPKAEPAANDRSELKRYMAAFGAERGAQWYAEGKSFSDAQAAHAEELDVENKRLKAHIAGLEGDDAPVSFGAASDPATSKKAGKLANTLGERLGRAAAAIKLPQPE